MARLPPGQPVTIQNNPTAPIAQKVRAALTRGGSQSGTRRDLRAPRGTGGAALPMSNAIPSTACPMLANASAVLSVRSCSEGVLPATVVHRPASAWHIRCSVLAAANHAGIAACSSGDRNSGGTDSRMVDTSCCASLCGSVVKWLAATSQAASAENKPSTARCSTVKWWRILGFSERLIYDRIERDEAAEKLASDLLSVREL